MIPDSFTTLLDRNRSFAEQFEAGHLPIRPRMPTIILTCLDARVDPAHLFGLELGEVLVMRNAGGRITPAVLEDLAILGVLAANMPGSSKMKTELVILHHTDCGMCRFTNPELQRQAAERLDRSVDEIAAMAITDPAESVQSDIQRLRSTFSAPDQLVVSGLVYDVKTGAINQVVSPAPLRTAGSDNPLSRFPESGPCPAGAAPDRQA